MIGSMNGDMAARLPAASPREMVHRFVRVALVALPARKRSQESGIMRAVRLVAFQAPLARLVIYRLVLEDKRT